MLFSSRKVVGNSGNRPNNVFPAAASSYYSNYLCFIVKRYKTSLGGRFLNRHVEGKNYLFCRKFKEKGMSGTTSENVFF